MPSRCRKRTSSRAAPDPRACAPLIASTPLASSPSPKVHARRPLLVGADVVGRLRLHHPRDFVAHPPLARLPVARPARAVRERLPRRRLRRVLRRAHGHLDRQAPAVPLDEPGRRRSPRRPIRGGPARRSGICAPPRRPWPASARAVPPIAARTRSRSSPCRPETSLVFDVRLPFGS